jgi:hypothetical protein
MIYLFIYDFVQVFILQLENIFNVKNVLALMLQCILQLILS